MSFNRSCRFGEADFSHYWAGEEHCEQSLSKNGQINVGHALLLLVSDLSFLWQYLLKLASLFNGINDMVMLMVRTMLDIPRFPISHFISLNSQDCLLGSVIKHTCSRLYVFWRTHVKPAQPASSLCTVYFRH